PLPARRAQAEPGGVSRRPCVRVTATTHTPSRREKDAMTTFALQKNPQPQTPSVRDVILGAPVFGTQFTDHMSHIRYTQEQGWHGHEVIPYGPLSLDPAAAVLHYAQEIFEGLKAYRHADGSVWTFRPDRNAERMNKDRKSTR